MTTISIVPEFPIPKQSTKVVFALTQSGTNFVRAWATIAPPGSSIDNLIKSTKDPRNRVEVYADSGGIDLPYEYSFDKGGKYTFVCQEYIKGSGYGGGYEGDPAGSDSESQVGSESTVVVYIGQKLIQKIGPPENRAEIHLWVWNDTVKQTYRIIHGEDTPCVTATAPNSLVRAAIESNSVKTAANVLTNTSVTTILGDLASLVSEYITVWNTHVVDTGLHINSDSVNVIPESFNTAYTPSTLKDFVNSALSVQRYHFNNDDQTGPGNGDYHPVTDRKNTSLYTSVGSFEDSYGAFADLIRTYVLHNSDASVHPSTSGDSAFELSPRPPLLALHETYLNIIGSSNPTPPPAQSTGAQLLISSAGFKES